MFQNNNWVAPHGALAHPSAAGHGRALRFNRCDRVPPPVLASAPSAALAGCLRPRAHRPALLPLARSELGDIALQVPDAALPARSLVDLLDRPHEPLARVRYNKPHAFHATSAQVG